jgi:hypothetical protein
MAKNGPGGKEVGRISVRVVPDTSKFPDELKRDLKRIQRELKLQIPISFDTTGVKEELKKVQKEAEDAKVKLPAEVDGDDVVKKTRRIKNLAQKAVGAIKMTLGINTAESVAKLKAQVTLINKLVKGYNIKIPVDVVGWTKVLAIAGLISAAFLTTQNIIGGVGGALSALGGTLATIPALAVGAAAGIGVLATGLHGFFSTLGEASNPEKFAEALKNLAPNAQDAAKQLAKFRQPLSEIRKATQQQLFKDMDKEFQRISALLPVIKTGFVGIASGIRGMFTDWIRMATSLQSVRDLRTILLNTKQGFQAARPAAADFGQALRDLATVGSSFFPRMGTAIANAARDFRDFIANARKTGELRAWIEGAIETFKQLGRIISNVWNIFSDIREAMSAGDVGFLDILEEATKALRDMTSSDEGQKFFKDLAAVMREVLDVAKKVFKEIFNSVSAILGDAMPFIRQFIQAFGVALVAALRVVTPLLQSVARWLSENKEIMAPLLVAIVGIVTAFKLLVTVGNGIKSIKSGFDVIKASAGILKTFMSGMIGTTKKVVSGFVTMANNAAIWAKTMGRYHLSVARDAVKRAATTAGAWIAQSAKATAQAIKSVIKMAATMIANFVKVAAAAALQAGITAAAWISQMISMSISVLRTLAITVAAWVANWVRMAAVAMANAIRIAAAWLIAMGPIGIIIGLIVALVAVVVLNWDKIWAVTKKVFGAIWDFISGLFTDALDWIGGWFTTIINWFKTFPGKVLTSLGDLGNWLINKGKDLLNGLWNGIKWVANQVWTWFSNLGSKIAGFFAGAGSWLWNAGKNIVQGLIDGIISMYNSVLDAMGLITKDLKGGFEADLKMHSPSRVFYQYGVFITQGLVNGLKATTASVESASKDVGVKAASAFNASFEVGSSITDGIKSETPTAVAAMEDMIGKVNKNADATWKGTVESDQSSLSEAVSDALSGWTIQMDHNGLWKIVEKQKTLNARRR